MTIQDALLYVLAGFAASMIASALGAFVGLGIAWWRARNDFAEIDAIVGDLPRVPQERDRA